jgi:molecular chaperone DnaJ
MENKHDHYQVLQVRPNATQAEIKQAYRRLAKLLHPDRHRDGIDHDPIARLNVAYEVLGDPDSRRSYDRQIGYAAHRRSRSAQATESSETQSKRRRHSGQEVDQQIHAWIQGVYTPVNLRLGRILYSLQDQIDSLAADPFDDELMDEFQAYLEDCRQWLKEAQRSFQSMPNPANVAGAAANLYHCLSQVGDGLDELEWFTNSYAEHYLHTGQELFRIANGLRREAQVALKDFV